MIYYLSLGSNLADRKENLTAALAALGSQNIIIKKTSSLYETEPVDIQDQPYFYNMAVEVECPYDPWKLLGILKNIEAQIGRVPTFSKGPRMIDIDILLAEELVISSPNLQIPHPGLAKRNFVLVPLNEIAPDANHPSLRVRIKTLACTNTDTANVSRIQGNLYE